MSKLHTATVVMFNPTDTIQLFRWWLLYGYWDEYCRYRESRLSSEMEKKYPQLRRVNSMEFVEPMATLRDRVASPILGNASKKGQRVFSQVSLEGPHFPLTAGAHPAVDQEGSTLNGGFAYVLMGYPEMEVLGWFPAEMQDRIATWQILLPSQKKHDPSDLRSALTLGFFPETSRFAWRRKYGNDRVSKGTSYGMGVLVNPHVIWAQAGGVEMYPGSPFSLNHKNFVLSTAR